VRGTFEGIGDALEGIGNALEARLVSVGDALGLRVARARRLLAALALEHGEHQ
jgi:hypothetical protein